MIRDPRREARDHPEGAQLRGEEQMASDFANVKGLLAHPVAHEVQDPVL